MTRPPFWFRWILRVLPADFREQRGEDIVELAAEHAAGRSASGRALVWTRVAADVIRVAVRTRWGAGRRPGPGSGWGHEARQGARALRRDPGFALFAVLIVGLGIGACVTVFSVVRSLLLRPLPFAEPERLVWVSNGAFGRGQALSEISVQAGYLVDLRTEATQMEDVGGFHLFDRDGDHTLGGPGEPVRVTRLRVTENFFRVLGIRPLLGRDFTAEEAWDDGPPAVLLTHGFWMRRFAADPDVVGSALPLDGGAATIVGVLPAAFDFGSVFQPGRRIDYVAPFPLSARSDRTGNTLGLIGRLAPGATPASAAAEARALAERAPPEASDVHSGRRNGFDPVVTPLREHVAGSFRPAMMLLVGAVGLVMLLVCANLSNLLLARGTVRERELAIRAAMGAGRGRLMRQLLTESVMLSAAGTTLGIGLAWLGTRVLSRVDLRIPLLDQTRMDGTALALAVGAAVATGLLVGVAPALRGTRVDLHEALKDAARGSSQGRRHGALRSALVVGQIAIAAVLLVGSSLLGRSLGHLLDVDLGYETGRTVALRVDPSNRFPTRGERVAFYAAMLDRARAVPGIAAAGLSDIVPMGFNRRWSADREGGDPEERVYPFVRLVSDGYADAMGLRLVSGRDLGPGDGPDSAPVALVNETLAARLWPGGDALGGTLVSSGRSYTVVGVVRDTRQQSVDTDPGPEMFFSIRQSGENSQVFLVARGELGTQALVDAVRRAVRTVSADVPLDQVTTLRAIVDGSLAPRRFLVTLLLGFGLFSLVLSALGVYAVVSYAVAHRRREIGIRLALGATPGAVQGGLVRETMTLAAVGLVLGLTGAALAGRVVVSLLYGVGPLDPATYVSVVAVFAAAASAAGYVPSRRAARVDPRETLVGDGCRPASG